MKTYLELSEIEKIPIRIERAKEIALKDLRSGVDLNESLDWCIINEQYCGAEGIKRAIEEYKS